MYFHFIYIVNVFTNYSREDIISSPTCRATSKKSAFSFIPLCTCIHDALICGVVLRIAFSLLEAVITFTKGLGREKRKRFNGDDVGGEFFVISSKC